MAERRTIMDYLGSRDVWIGRVVEDVIDPGREIVDPHHHLWSRPGSVYELDALWGDTGSGHNVVQTVFVECRAYYDKDRPEHLRYVGETARVAEFCAASAAAPGATVAGIVGHADLRSDRLDEVLDAHEAVGGGYFRGIRQAGAFEPEAQHLMIPGRGPAGLYSDPDFRRGVARLGERGLSYDTWHYHHQNRDFAALARAVPGTTMVLDHLGTPLGVSQYAGKRAEIFDAWQDDMEEIAQCPNVVAKLGGMAMPDNGYGWHERHLPPTSDEFVEVQGIWYEHMIECFGAERCMFESNYPVDKASVGYRVLWNAFKKVAAGCSEDEKAALFAGTARRVYRL